MLSLVREDKITEVRFQLQLELLLLEEYVDELDAIINGPAAFGHQILRLSDRDGEFFQDVMDKPPKPNESLIELFKEFASSKKDKNSRTGV